MKKAIVRAALIPCLVWSLAVPQAPAQDKKPDGHLAFSFKDVKIQAPGGGGEPFEINKHWSAMERAAIVITGALEVRWDNSIFSTHAAVMDAEGKTGVAMLYVGEDDTTPNPVGVISQIWSDLFPEVNDEEGLILTSVRYTVPTRSAKTSTPFKLIVTHGKLAFNDDSSDFELVIHSPKGVGRFGGLTIDEQEAKHFLPSVNIRKIEREVEREEPQAQEDPSFTGLNR